MPYNDNHLTHLNTQIDIRVNKEVKQECNKCKPNNVKTAKPCKILCSAMRSPHNKTLCIESSFFNKFLILFQKLDHIQVHKTMHNTWVYDGFSSYWFFNEYCNLYRILRLMKPINCVQKREQLFPNRYFSSSTCVNHRWKFSNFWVHYFFIKCICVLEVLNFHCFLKKNIFSIKDFFI